MWRVSLPGKLASIIQNIAHSWNWRKRIWCRDCCQPKITRPHDSKQSEFVHERNRMWRPLPGRGNLPRRFETQLTLGSNANQPTLETVVLQRESVTMSQNRNYSCILSWPMWLCYFWPRTTIRCHDSNESFILNQESTNSFYAETVCPSCEKRVCSWINEKLFWHGNCWLRVTFHGNSSQESVQMN